MTPPIARLLIVDDEPAALRALCDTLQGQGYETAGFASGEAALDAMQDQRFDLLLTDLIMPRMSGVQLMTAALRMDPAIVSILMTGKGTIETAVEAMQAGALDYVLKPIRHSTLLPVLTRALRVHRLRLENLELRDTVSILELNQTMAHTLDSRVLLDKIADTALAQLNADEASIMLLHEDGQALQVAAVRGANPQQVLGERLPVGQGIPGQVAQLREPLADPCERDTPGPATLSIPMMTQNRLIGVLTVSSRWRRRPFSLGQAKLLSIFTNAAATSIRATQLIEAQRRSDARYNEILRMAADGIVSIDAQQRIVVFNRAAEILFGYRSDEVLGRPLSLLLPAESGPSHRDLVQSFSSDPAPMRTIAMRSHPLSCLRKDGSVFKAEIAISKLFENDQLLYTAVVRDITQRLQQEAGIARLTRIQRVLSGINSAIVRLHERDALFREACRIAVELGGFGRARIDLISPDHGDPVSAAAAGDPKLETFPDGESRPPSHSGIALPLLLDGQLTGCFSLYVAEPDFFDAEELKLLNELAGDISFALDYIAKKEQLTYLACFDTLTDLPNRTLFLDRLQQYVVSARQSRHSCAVALFNLERFRNVNATFGRHACDALLQEVALRLQDALAPRQTLCRAGGDHFAIALQKIEDASAMASVVDQIIVAVFGPPFETQGTSFHLTARAGIALYPDDGNDADTLLQNAEAALESPWHSDGPYQFFSAQMNDTVAQNLRTENKLHDALAQQQFVLHYQPKVRLDTGLVCGFEALIRWNDPERGLVLPGHFIPFLEESGMIFEVGRWALHQAVQDHCRWTAMGLSPPPVSVNVSVLQLRQRDFPDVVREAIMPYGTNPHGLHLEITESLLMEDIEASIANLQALRHLAVDLHVDDFGTGYSSLAYLARLPVSTLKIDRSFVNTMTDTPESRMIVSTIISLAHALNITVVAEGIETEEQLTFLRHLNCDEGQGYLFSTPVDPSEVPHLMTRFRTGRP